MSLEFSQSLISATPPEEVWLALTDPTRVSEYHLAPLRILEPRKGGRIIYGPEGNDMIVGEVTEFTPGRCLEHTFRFMPGHMGTANDPETLVRYDIAAGPEGTKLTLTHSGFPEENQTYANISGGWPYILEGLGKYLG